MREQLRTRGGKPLASIPVSLRVSDLIYRAYEASIQHTVTSAEELTSESG